MDRNNRHDDTPGIVANARLGLALLVFGLAAVVVFSALPTAESAPYPAPAPGVVRSAATDPSRFVLNALLAPAIDDDATPLRWVDPRPAMGCGSASAVRVNGEPLLPGAPLPDRPFVLTWQADDCRPFGANGPRFDGRVRLTVFREDWGFSAIVEPDGMRIQSANQTIALRAGGATLPQCVDAVEAFEPALGSERALHCQ